MTYPAHPDLEAFLISLESAPRMPGIVGYAIGDRYRGPAAQAAALAAGTSTFGYGQSAHNVADADDAWRGAAVDIFPVIDIAIQDVDGNGLPDVSGDPADYQPILDLAASMGLENLGALYGFDYAHVQIPNWDNYPVVGGNGSTPSSLRVGKLLLVGLLFWAAGL
jgi:hypothetical protein